jgi:hypothetical protein
MRRREEMKKNIAVQRAPVFFGGISGIAPELGFMQYPARLYTPKFSGGILLLSTGA